MEHHSLLQVSWSCFKVPIACTVIHSLEFTFHYAWNGTYIPSFVTTAIYNLEPGRLRSQTTELSGPLQETPAELFSTLDLRQNLPHSVHLIWSPAIVLIVYFKKNLNSSTRNSPSFLETGLGKCINISYLSVNISVLLINRPLKPWLKLQFSEVCVSNCTKLLASWMFCFPHQQISLSINNKSTQ